ncbi:MAG: hypothetical protein KJ057_06635 [Phycisphaerae bacterium]|nr:MAG: hypothetical protein EDS66_03805 [Planctomycetota bacterium]KAB2946485.1 MAG: hypothetical protein F9K17_08395 [Phycisphaerae bacterium]MBE7456698.1 hypothetical protein [Planctomycetia bacterium]MCK6463924.1 hypothetical protein [Phycisphaerae bacterium]MCL4718137.1 hypothetical protein [Phycisphaerae bacterium]
MNMTTETSTRKRTVRTRTVPVEVLKRTIPWGGTGRIEVGPNAGPVELILEVTGPDGDLASWFDDFWWVDALTMYKDRSVTVHIAPTPGAVLSPVVLHQMQMLRRVEPRWTAIGYLRAEELSDPEIPRKLRGVPYHEVRVIVRSTRKLTDVARDEGDRRIAAILGGGTANPEGASPPRITCVSEHDAKAAGILTGTGEPADGD